MRKILIVEDDTLLNKTLAYNLTSEGYETVSAFTYASAVAHLQKNEFDLVCWTSTCLTAADWTCVKKSGPGARTATSCS